VIDWEACRDFILASHAALARPVYHPHAMRGRGNPYWGKFQPHSPALPTEFETQAKRLGLSASEYAASNQLKHWCECNRNRVYVPEWLLKAWGLRVEDTLTGAA
jgi:hypothetical protein